MLSLQKISCTRQFESSFHCAHLHYLCKLYIARTCRNMHNKKQEFAEKLEIEYEKQKINFMQKNQFTPSACRWILLGCWTGLIAHIVHETVDFLRIERLPCLYVCLEIFYRHIYCLSNFTAISPPIFRASMPSPSIRPILIRSLLCDQLLQKIATLPHGT